MPSISFTANFVSGSLVTSPFTLESLVYFPPSPAESNIITEGGDPMIAEGGNNLITE